MDYINLIVTHPFLLLWLGQLVHILKSVKEIENQAPGVTMARYIKRHKYGTAFSIVAGLACYAILYEMGDLSAVSAFMAGYMSESVMNAAASRVTRKVSGDEYGVYSSGSSGDGFDPDTYKNEEYYEYYADDTRPARIKQDGTDGH
jgi:hypothetical protein